MTARAPRTGPWARSGVVGAGLARAGWAQLSHKGSAWLPGGDAAAKQAEHEARLGRILFGTLNQLKGTALKASQLLSMELGLLPEGLREQLARAHYQATPLNRAHVLKLLKQEFGRGPEALFADFEPEAFAAASLGQVHRARSRDGQALAVKLQYPGMAAVIASDMRLLRALLQGLRHGGLQLPDPALLERVLGDIETKLVEELDYALEARMLSEFAQALTLPGLHLPRPVEALSSARVLSMEFMAGQHLDAWLATSPSQAARDRAGQLLVDSFWHSAFGLRRLHVDPHPGNYLFRDGGELVMLDFGRVQPLPAMFLRGLTDAWEARLRQDDAALLQAYVSLGLVDPAMSRAEFRAELLGAIEPLLDWQLGPWRQDMHDFATQAAAPPMDAERHRRAVRHLRALPDALPFFDRAYLGMVQLLRRLGARVRTGQPWRTAAALRAEPA